MAFAPNVADPVPIILHHTASDTAAPSLLYAGEAAVAHGPTRTKLWVGDGSVNRLLLSTNPADNPLLTVPSLPLSVANGGTGANNAAAAQANLGGPFLPMSVLLDDAFVFKNPPIGQMIIRTLIVAGPTTIPAGTHMSIPAIQAAGFDFVALADSGSMNVGCIASLQRIRAGVPTDIGSFQMMGGANSSGSYGPVTFPTGFLIIGSAVSLLPGDDLQLALTVNVAVNVGPNFEIRVVAPVPIGLYSVNDIHTNGRLSVGTPTGPAVTGAGNVNISGGYYVNGVPFSAGIPEPSTAGNFLRTNTGTWVEGLPLSSLPLSVANGGIPAGGTQWQVLGKTSATDRAVAWQDAGMRPNDNFALGTNANPLNANFGSVAIGPNTLVNDTAYGNIAIGDHALNATVNTMGNIAIGSWVLYASTGGQNIGINGLGSNTTGSENVGVGGLYNNTTGSQNVAIGESSLGETGAGNRNVALGAYAARFVGAGTALNAVSDSVYVGRDTRASANGNTNEIVIGASAVGRGSNTVTLGTNAITQLWCGGRDILAATSGGPFLPLTGGTLSGGLGVGTPEVAGAIRGVYIHATQNLSCDETLFIQDGKSIVSAPSGATLIRFDPTGAGQIVVGEAGRALVGPGNLTVGGALSVAGAPLVGGSMQAPYITAVNNVAVGEDLYVARDVNFTNLAAVPAGQGFGQPILYNSQPVRSTWAMTWDGQGLQVNNFGAGVGAMSYIDLRSGRGTAAAPAARQAGDPLGSIYFSGAPFNTSQDSSAWISAVATETWNALTGAALRRGSDLLFVTTPNGGLGGPGLQAMTIRGSGQLVLERAGILDGFRLGETTGFSLGGDATSWFAIYYTPSNNSQGLWMDSAGNFEISGGTATKPGSTTWVNPSDNRLKRDVEPYKTGLDAVLRLEPIWYCYNGRGETVDDGTRYVGLVSEDVQGIMPEIVGHKEVRMDPPDEPLDTREKMEAYYAGPYTDILTIDSSALIFALVNAVKELDRKVVALEAR